MKKFRSMIKEDEQGKQDTSILKNPAFLHNSWNDALMAAKKMSSGAQDIYSRAYIIKYKYATQEHLKPYIVVNNRELVSQEPKWDTKGYTIVGWVSPSDGVVIRNQDGTYIKGENQ